MTAIYNDMKKGVLFSTSLNGSEWHSFKTYGMYLAQKSIGSPDPYTYQITIPGRDGVYDLTEQVYNGRKYKNRKLSISLLVMDANTKWASVYSKILYDLHGKMLYVTFDEDRDFAYYGRVTIDKFQTARHKGMITLNVDAAPYKRYRYTTSEQITIDGKKTAAWLWDPFSFQDGIIQENYWNMNGTQNIVIRHRGKSMPTRWFATCAVTITYNGKTYNVPGDSQWHDDIGLNLSQGNYTLTVSGTGGYLKYTSEMERL